MTSRESAGHFAAVAEVLRAIDLASVEHLARRLVSARQRGALVFVVGNGRSAALASHFVCDLQKVCHMRALSLDNAPLLTAWSNDVDYKDALARQLKVVARGGDLLIVISCSGTSGNILQALAEAKQGGMVRLAIFGALGRAAAMYSDAAVIIPSVDYGVIEDCASAVCHAIVKALGETDEAP